ncbi:SAM-dependent methyltransferase [Streptomyces evansiae]|uniref:SAM-dependent methyltransferase n=1 Tax=Streptomyces evansiae TaxID=3075535 RepID=UPI0028880F87|nr:SAM-dependent methyltransferase [Streptomyces sp. DSM 41859]MDT0425493.1 SAM-dependent methyltransferase [Streptomyces sp. DSM 41859]
MCAGQGHDLLGVLAAHPRRADVRAHLVELDPRNAAEARAAAAGLGLGDRVAVVTGDAALVRNYADAVPAALVLLCGVLGNVADEGMEETVDRVSRLCAPGGTLVWTRNRKAPDRVPRVCDWLEARGFTRDSLSPPDVRQAVAAHRRTGPAAPLPLPHTRCSRSSGTTCWRSGRGDERRTGPVDRGVARREGRAAAHRRGGRRDPRADRP